MGIEEEFLVIDQETGDLAGRAGDVLAAARPVLAGQVTSELSRCQVETNTPTCATLGDAEVELRRLRRGLADAAATLGAATIALASHPWSAWDDQEPNTDKAHYRALLDTHQQVAREQVVCGCHIHVGVDAPDERIMAMNLVRPWLPALLALSANSPWWQGDDTGYASYRTMVWRAWPTAVMPPWLADHQHYEDLVGALQSVGAIDAPSALYWWVRPASELATLEFRVCDVCLEPEDAVTIAGLARALTETCLDGGVRGAAPPDAVLDAALWRAARFGLEGALVDPAGSSLRPAPAVIAGLVEMVTPALREAGDLERVTCGIDRILRRGNGAVRQREVLTGSPDHSAAVATLRAASS